MPIYRRLPKRGFVNNFRKLYATLNIGTLDSAIETGRLPAGQDLDEAALRAAGVVRSSAKFIGVRLLGKGEIKRAVRISVSGASAAAIAAVEAAGGSVTITAPATPAEAG